MRVDRHKVQKWSAEMSRQTYHILQWWLSHMGCNPMLKPVNAAVTYLIGRPDMWHACALHSIA